MTIYRWLLRLLPGSFRARQQAELEDAAREQLAAAGHELANHSWAHRYELTRLPRARIAEEIDRGHAAVAACAGSAPTGSWPRLREPMPRGLRT